jgi:hypothetical protein
MNVRRLACCVLCCSSLLAFADGQTTISDTASKPDGEAKVAALPCRPTIACTADLVPAGNFEVELGYGARRSDNLVHSGQVLLKYSLFDSLQFQLGTVGLFSAGEGTVAHAFDGVTPGVKWKFFDGSTFVPMMAVSGHVDLPTSNASYATQQTVDLEAWVYFSKDLGRFHGDLNLALKVFDVTHPLAQGLVATSWSTNLWGPFSVFTEVYSTLGGDPSLARDGGWLSGINIAPLDNVMFDVGGDVGFYPGTRTFSVFAGVTFVPGAHPSSSPLAVGHHHVDQLAMR